MHELILGDLDGEQYHPELEVQGIRQIAELESLEDWRQGGRVDLPVAAFLVLPDR